MLVVHCTHQTTIAAFGWTRTETELFRPGAPASCLAGPGCCDVYAHYACVPDCADAMAHAWEDTAGCAHADCLFGNVRKR